ncbi:glycosyltransferase [Myxococcus sp. AB056]|uniref:glycosyltransferase n=1 Tax=Myxococcus sp. AB056 TaxID=2562792 RepID=UPI001146CFBE|nr:glycosyltransferase [Myxococcus sp. AB056]
MSTLLVCPLPERGHINPSLKLARALQKRGHRIVFCGIRDTEALIRAEGFDFECLFEHLFPLGFQDEVKERVSQWKGLKRVRYLLQVLRKQNQMYESVLQGELDAIITRTRPDLGLTDVLLPEPFLVLRGHQVPTLVLNTSIPMRWELMTPPPTSNVIPDGQLSGIIRGALDWGRILFASKMEDWRSWVGLEPADLRYRHALARKYGYPPEHLDFAGRLSGEHDPMLVLCPREFVEFSGVRLSIDVHYTGPCIDLERKEPDFPWERLSPERPLVLCSLGTMAMPPEQARRFHEAVTEAARRRPAWQFVVATNEWRETLPGPVPNNLVSVTRVPQLQMLRRASAMVTHGGFNSVKECIYFGVPMVVLPVQYDQPGIAARVVHHGLGQRADLRSLTPDTLVPLLDAVVEQPSYRHELERMKARFQAAEEEQALVDAIERHLPGTSASGAPGQHQAERGALAGS